MSLGEKLVRPAAKRVAQLYNASVRISIHLLKSRLKSLQNSGPTTIARTIACEYPERKRLGASFFVSRGGEDAGHPGKFFRSVAVQLADKSPSLKRNICDTVMERGYIASQALRYQSKLEGGSSQSLLIRLDECLTLSTSASALTLLDRVCYARAVPDCAALRPAVSVA